jgi:hypothetical protein
MRLSWREDHQRQTVGRNGGQSHQSRFSSTGEQERAHELRRGAAKKIGMKLVAFARSPNMYLYAGKNELSVAKDNLGCFLFI